MNFDTLFPEELIEFYSFYPKLMENKVDFKKTCSALFKNKQEFEQCVAILRSRSYSPNELIKDFSHNQFYAKDCCVNLQASTEPHLDVHEEWRPKLTQEVAVKVGYDIEISMDGIKRNGIELLSHPSITNEHVENLFPEIKHYDKKTRNTEAIKEKYLPY